MFAQWTPDVRRHGKIVEQDGLSLPSCAIQRAGIEPANSRGHLRQPALSGTQEVARAAKLEIFLRQHEAVVRIHHDLQPLLGFWRRIVGQEKAIGLIRSTTDSPAELMQLRQTKPI